MITLENDNLEKIINENEKVFVQYGAAWCGNCTMIKPKVSKLSEDYSDLKFIYVDAEKFPNSRQLANVQNLPTFATFLNGELVSQKMGNKIEKIKELADEITSN